MHGDLAFAKREMAWGKLTPDDLDELFRLFTAILVPLFGMSTIADIFERIAERRGWVDLEDDAEHQDDAEFWERNPGAQSKAEEKMLWNDIMKTLHEPFAIVSQAMDEGLLHAGLLLEILPKTKPKKGEKTGDAAEEADVEAKADQMNPGEPGFSGYLQSKLTEFYNRRGETLRLWAKEKGLSQEEFDSAKGPDVNATSGSLEESVHRRDQQQLYLILYMEHLLWSTGSAIKDLVKFAEEKVERGEMKKNRLILPGKRRLKKWLMSIGKEDSTVSEETPDSMESGKNTIYMGAGYGARKDPEHLPAETAWQHFGNYLRHIPHFLGSVESAFGFRVACATITVGIVAFLKDTQVFFIEQRLVWAMIIIAIGMTVVSITFL